MTHSAQTLRRYHAMHSELEMRPYVSLEEDALASEIARLMRLNSRFDAERVLTTAARYVREWKKAFPNHEIGVVAAPMTPAGTTLLVNPPREEPAGVPHHDRSAA